MPLTLPAQYSERNVLNSVSLFLASQILAAGYLVYWHKRDLLQISATGSGWYPEYSKNQATYLLDPTFSAAYTAAKGVISLVDSLPAVPRFITRLTSDSGVGPADEVPIPCVAVQVGSPVPVGSYELGTTTKWRNRHLLLDCFARTQDEQRALADLLMVWLDENTIITVANHDDGSLATVGPLEVLDVTTIKTETVDKSEALTYEVLLNARLEYVA